MKTFIKGLVLSAVVASSQVYAEQTLNVYAWGGYLPEKSLKAFEQQ